MRRSTATSTPEPPHRPQDWTASRNATGANWNDNSVCLMLSRPIFDRIYPIRLLLPAERETEATHRGGLSVSGDRKKTAAD
jgi:hypothetical protein